MTNLDSSDLAAILLSSLWAAVAFCALMGFTGGFVITVLITMAAR